MNSSKLYVPNPQKWVDFFDKVAQGKVKLDQHGGGNVSHIIPMDQYASSHSNTTQLPVKIVSPSEQVVDQAKSELERENIKPTQIKNMAHKSKSRRGKHTHNRKTRAHKKPRNQKGGKIGKKTRGKKRGKIHKIKNKKDIFNF